MSTLMEIDIKAQTERRSPLKASNFCPSQGSNAFVLPSFFSNMLIVY